MGIETAIIVGGLLYAQDRQQKSQERKAKRAATARENEFKLEQEQERKARRQAIAETNPTGSLGAGQAEGVRKKTLGV